MSEFPIVSVIMPCYNASKHLRKTIGDLFNQSFTRFELIAVNDGSTDDTLDLLNSLANTYTGLHVITQDNKGCAQARNTGLRYAKGKYIAFLDSDDSWDNDYLFKLHHALENNADAVLAYCGWQNIGVGPKRGKPYIPPDYETINKLETFLRECPWPIHAALVKRNLIERNKGFRSSLNNACEDYDLWLRIATFNKVVLVPEVLAFYHHHSSNQVTNNRLQMALNHLKVQLDFINSEPKVTQILNQNKLTEITYGGLLHRAYLSYWQRDLPTAHALFRKALKVRHFKTADLKYLVPAVLPFVVYRYLITHLGK